MAIPFRHKNRSVAVIIIVCFITGFNRKINFPVLKGVNKSNPLSKQSIFIF